MGYAAVYGYSPVPLIRI